MTTSMEEYTVDNTGSLANELLNHTFSPSTTISTLIPEVHNYSGPSTNLTAEQQLFCARYQSYCQYRIGIDIVIVGALCIFGLVGNSIAVLVLRADNVNKLVSFLLQALAIADNAYLICCFFTATMKTVNDCTRWIPRLFITYAHLEVFVWPIASISQMTGVWLVVLVTLDRYLAICHPFDKFRSFIDRNAKKGVVIIPIVAIVYNIPRFFEREVILGPELCSNTTKAWSMNTDLRENRMYFIFYKTIAFFLFRMIIPLLTLMILNIKLIFTLKEAKRDRVRLTQNQNNTRKDSFTVVLVAVVTVFIVCQLPDFILRLLLAIKNFVSFELHVRYVAHITNMLLSVNSSVNVVIYCLTGKRFRRTMRRIVLCQKGRAFHNYSESRMGNTRGTFTMYTLKSKKLVAQHGVW